MLDDLKYINERDAEDALGIATRQGEQLKPELRPTGNLQFGKVYNVVYAGMGGSAFPAMLVKTWADLPEPFEIVRDYEIPAYVDNETLFIASSYSGNTEETLSALAQAEARGAQIAVIAGGGKLHEIAQQKGYAYVQLPQAAQPRYAVLYNFQATLEILGQAGLVQIEGIREELARTSKFLDKATQAWVATVPTASNPAKQLAQELVGKSVVIYGGPKTYPAAYKWKISINENAKQIAWLNQLPEFNHNEFIGWSQQPVEKPYAVIDLRSNLENPSVQKRFEVTARLLSGMRPDPHVVEAQGQTLLEQLVWTIAYGDFVSLYLALLNGFNPAPVELVEKFKKALTE